MNLLRELEETGGAEWTKLRDRMADVGTALDERQKMMKGELEKVVAGRIRQSKGHI